ncbi:hypothetical protein GGR26_002345 [Lewinella marina]|uniref:Uncharacterized protein n=1 Tax=Neolewinella marina TaxID=438751 RepID=A0A2G0CG71_9BACT|nr:hypothetical protein [Neolewinella marina]NJB86577.1 hypothetical protein [Neolewinella marina]PHK98971.1 hypothetical protein CGL56_05785 [Neolewinella marina]
MFVPTLCRLLLVFCLPLGMAAQQTAAQYLESSSRAVDPDRYREVRGDPYRYATFRPGVLYDAALKRYAVDSLNFNGFTSQFEYRHEGKLRELANRHFLRVHTTGDEGEEHIYAFGINPKFPNKYAELVYTGDFVTATLVYDVANDVKVVQDVGKTMRLRRFTPSPHYYAFVDGELTTLRLNPRRLPSDLGLKGPVSRFIREHNLDPQRRADLLRILAYADELYNG